MRGLSLERSRHAAVPLQAPGAVQPVLHPRGAAGGGRRGGGGRGGGNRRGPRGARDRAVPHLPGGHLRASQRDSDQLKWFG